MLDDGTLVVRESQHGLGQRLRVDQADTGSTAGKGSVDRPLFEGEQLAGRPPGAGRGLRDHSAAVGPDHVVGLAGERHDIGVAEQPVGDRFEVRDRCSVAECFGDAEKNVSPVERRRLLRQAGRGEEHRLDRADLGEASMLGRLLVHHGGQPFTRADFRGKWTFLYFGYTYCPDVCPLTLVELDRLQKRLAEQGADGDTAYVLVSVDPQRDTPERLREYVTYFNPKFQGATGPADELSRLAKPLYVIYQRGSDSGDATNYTIDHSSTISLIDPTGRPRAIFTPPQNPERMAADFLKIRAAAP